jgi:hypothetical protein
MEIWVFDTITRCNDTQPPNALGTMYADGACHSVVVKDSESADDIDLFPGNYRAVCTSEGKIRFLDSGCASETCTSTSLNSDVSTCDRNTGTTSSLYSRLNVPEYIVQDKSEASVGGYYTCLRLQGADSTTVTFVVFGDCSQSDCQESEGTDSPAGGTESSPAPTRAPAVVSTTEPTNEGSTLEPTGTSVSTESPVRAPTPNEVPTTLAPVTAAPITAPPNTEPAQPTTTTASPTITPIDDPTDAPVEEPSATTTESPIESTPSPVEGGDTPRPSTDAAPTPAETVTPKPASRPSASSPTSEKAMTGSTTLTLRLSPMTTKLDEATSLLFWETRTKEQITESANATGITVLELTFSNVAQSLNGARRQTRRLLQQSSLLLDFGVSMKYLSSKSDVSVAEIVNGAFDSETDRLKYLRRFGNTEPFNLVESVAVLVDGATPADIGDGSAVKSPESSNNGTLTGIGVGAAVLVMVVVGLLYHKRRRQQSGKSSTGMTKTNEVESPSSYGDMPMDGKNNGAGSPQRWTNEIVVDPSADDVSTLGGSVLAGLNLVEHNNAQQGEDEPTASVNLDYDYGRSRYRTEVDDRTRSHMTEGSAPTAFTNYSKLGMNVNSVYADDSSFEQQFADLEEDEDFRNRSLMKEESKGGNDINNRVKPFEVRAPPGKLGMVVDTPHGGVPVVRAIKPDSVLTGRVLIGDRLISVDYQDVTNMTALEVSSLISLKQDQVRLLVFCRLTPPTPTINNTA